jgi:hypothetical protein
LSGDHWNYAGEYDLGSMSAPVAQNQTFSMHVRCHEIQILFEIQVRFLSNVHRREIILHGLGIVIVTINAVFLFFASIHCPAVLPVQNTVCPTHQDLQNFMHLTLSDVAQAQKFDCKRWYSGPSS